MPATTPNPNKVAGGAKSENGRSRFVKCDLNKEQKEHLKFWKEEAEYVDLMKWLNHMVTEGHTLSVKSADVGFLATLTGVQGPTSHVGMCLTARASTPENALYSLWFKDSEILHGSWVATDYRDELDL